MEPQLDDATRLARIDALLTAFYAALNDDLGVLRVGLDDLLRIRASTAFMSGVVTNQRDQLLALTDVISMLLGRLIELIHMQATHHDNILLLLQTLAQSVGMDEIAQRATDARAVLQAADDARRAENERLAIQARALLSTARLAELGIIADAADEARDQIEHEKESSE